MSVKITEKKLKILELCHFSAGGCGVWQRAKQESLELAKKGYEIQIFSSNLEKGTDKLMPPIEKMGDILIQRFPAKKLGGESFMLWNFEKEAFAYSPDVIIAHNYRQPHTTKALAISRMLKKKNPKVKVFLVTHAPFVEGNITRTKLQTLIVNLYDKLIGPWTINRFDKIITISNWEFPYLIKIGAGKDKIRYIPNGIPEEFFKLKKQAKEENKILFLGRIAPKKKLETLIEAIPFIKDESVKIEIVGPREEDYYSFLRKKIKNMGLEKRIIFTGAIYELKEKIKKIDSCKVFVLPSRVEGMPQSLVEAMAREKLVIGSDSVAIRDLIINNKNGYLFEFDNPRKLAEKINQALEKNNQNSKIKSEARKSTQKFSWKNVVEQIESLF